MAAVSPGAGEFLALSGLRVEREKLGCGAHGSIEEAEFRRTPGTLEWFNIKAFGKHAEVVAEHLHKGSRTFLEGRQRTESWDDKQSGGKKYMTFVYADKVEFLGKSAKRASSHETSPTARKVPR